MSESTRCGGLTKEPLDQRLQELLGEFSGKPPWHEPDRQAERLREALALVNREWFPQKWGGLKGKLALVLPWRQEGSPQSHREEAIACSLDALSVFLRQQGSFPWVMTNHQLGKL